jgi:Flp pilus assembly pilin Flp
VRNACAIDVHTVFASADSAGFFTIQEQTMKSLMQRAVRFVRDSRGATMAEYAILVAVVAIVVIVGAKALGGSVSAKLNTAATNIESGN